MAPEIPEVNPGEVATAAEHNFAWRRAVQRYADAATRDIENPTPEAGDVAFLEDVATLMVYAGDGWGAVFGARDGIPSLPSITFESDPDTGMYRYGTNAIGLGVGGAIGAVLTSAADLFLGGDGGSTGSPYIKGPPGAALTPTYSFQGDTDTGMYRPADEVLAFATDGTNRAQLSEFALEIADPCEYRATPATSGAGANAVWETVFGGIMGLRRSTSARRYKSNIEYIV